eukprot:COSAG06_NODE_649_length_13411_cov_129.656477_3_plen_237_part_00
MDEDEVSYHVAALRTHGFTIVPNVIPAGDVPALREAVLAAQDQHAREHQRLAADPECWREIWPALAEGPAPAGPLAQGLLHFGGNPMLSDLCRVESLHPHLASPRVVAIAQRLLDPHVRIAQIAIGKTRPPNSQPLPGRGNRLWHTDWPHDLTAYDPLRNHPVRKPNPFDSVSFCSSRACLGKPSLLGRFMKTQKKKGHVVMQGDMGNVGSVRQPFPVRKTPLLRLFILKESFLPR